MELKIFITLGETHTMALCSRIFIDASCVFYVEAICILFVFCNSKLHIDLAIVSRHVFFFVKQREKIVFK